MSDNEIHEELHFTCIGVYNDDDRVENTLDFFGNANFWYHRRGAADRALPPWLELSYHGQTWDYDSNSWSPPYDSNKWRK